jgi:hypothetical protein
LVEAAELAITQPRDIAATQHCPAVVLGATAASQLGVGSTGPDQQVRLGGQWFTAWAS